MKNKKKGASSKTWVVDCLTDSAFDFALKVLKESENEKYPLELRVNFIKIAYSNSLETIARAQTDPEQYKLKSAFKLFCRNLKEIRDAVVKIYPKISDSLIKMDDVVNSSIYARDVVPNPFDYVDIHYEDIEEGMWQKKRKQMRPFADKYHFPVIYEEVCSLKDDVEATLQPTNDILIRMIPHVYRIIKLKLNLTEFYPNRNPNDFKVQSFLNHIAAPSPYGPPSVLVHVPYDSFSNIETLISVAAEHPEQVEEICVTAYRLGKDNSIIDSLIVASNKHIKCKLFIELSARGEVDNGLEYLEDIRNRADSNYLDIKVRYNGIKVHGKMIYIGMKNDKRAIGVFSTGNYNPQTATIYKDYHYVSCDENVTQMIRRNFSVLWNSEQPVLSSISNILSNEIYEEMGKGKDGKIWIQTNHLDNKQIVTFLREAIRRGCDVRLIVRTTKGFHKKDMKNCKTVVGKYLEHSRVYIFGSGRDRRVYLSSSDILFRNLYNRFECYVKIGEKFIQDQLVEDFKDLYKNGQK